MFQCQRLRKPIDLCLTPNGILLHCTLVSVDADAGAVNTCSTARLWTVLQQASKTAMLIEHMNPLLQASSPHHLCICHARRGRHVATMTPSSPASSECGARATPHLMSARRMRDLQAESCKSAHNCTHNGANSAAAISCIYSYLPKPLQWYAASSAHTCALLAQTCMDINGIQTAAACRCCKPKAVATCADTDINQAGSQTFCCPDGTLYKPGSGSANPPSVAACCLVRASPGYMPC
jgi:hypothetical protein